jgi:hypothetical protein
LSGSPESVFTTAPLFTVEEVALSALIRASGEVPLNVIEEFEGRYAALSVMSTFTANAPATPTFSAPVPDFASVLNVFTGLPDGAGPIPASTVRP